MARTPDQYLREVLKDAGYDDAYIASTVSSLTSNPKVVERLGQTLKTAEDDYNAQVGRVRALESDNKYLKDEWFPQANAEYQRMAREYQAVLDRQNSNRNPQPQGSGLPPEFDAARYMTKEDFVNTFKDITSKTATAIKTATKLASRHASRYQEELDLDAIDKIATEKNLSLEAAYSEFISPREAEKAKNERSDWEKRTRAEIEADLRSRNGFPADPIPSEAAPIHSSKTRAENKQPGQDIDKILMEAWNNPKG